MFELMPFGFNHVSNYNPFHDFDEMSRRFWNDSNIASFRTDITEKDGNFVLESELPGFKKEDINIDIENDVLTISAERKNEETEEDKQSGNVIRRERYYGSFSRSFNVEGIDTDAISASYNDGVLTLTMPKKTPEVPASRRLEIK